jgi:four helix bundle protein
MDAQNGSYRNLIVWQKGMELVVTVYEVTKQYPDDEKYGLTSQTRRSVVSIPANIAEGKRRGSLRDYVRFLNMAYASGAELETHLEIARRLRYLQAVDLDRLSKNLNEVMRVLNSMQRKFGGFTKQ